MTKEEISRRIGRIERINKNGFDDAFRELECEGVIESVKVVYCAGNARNVFRVIDDFR